MAQIIVMPALGNTVESCLVNAWLVAVGDVVDENTVVAEIETDKATMDLPAGASGTVLALLAAEGDEVPVKEPLLVLGAPGESADEVLSQAGLAAQALGGVGSVAIADPANTPDAAGPAGASVGSGSDAAGSVPSAADGAGASDARQGGAALEADPSTGAANSAGAASSTGAGVPDAVSPRARALADNAGLALESVGAGTGPHGRIIERDVTAALSSGRPTGSARGADIAGVPGTGIGGRVTGADLAASSTSGASTGGTSASGVSASSTSLSDVSAPVSLASLVDGFPGSFADAPLKGIRKIVAERMLNALATSAQLTYTVTAPAAAMLALRKRFKGTDPDLGYAGITLGDLVNFAAIATLKRHAGLNAHLLGQTLRTFDRVHLGLAVDTPRGLLVPTIRNADAMTLRQLSAATKELAAAAQSGKIDPDLLTGATFTVSNLGSFGMESFTPIINVPQTGILGVNAITPRATMNPDGSPGVEQRIGFSLTADHQVVDGADAARFLRDLSVAIADIDLTVMG